MSRMTSDRSDRFSVFPGIEQPRFQGLYSSLPWSAPREGRRETLEMRFGIEVLAVSIPRRSDRSVALTKWFKVGHFHHFSKISYYWNI